MADIRKYFPSWSDEKYNFSGAQPPRSRPPGSPDILDLVRLQAIWHVQRGGNLSDLLFNKTVGGRGRFDAQGNKVIVGRFAS